MPIFAFVIAVFNLLFHFLVSNTIFIYFIFSTKGNNMTLLVDENNLNIRFSVNQPNLADTYEFILTSQYSKTPVTLGLNLINSNDRYSQFEVTFPTGFGNEHKNGIYYYDLAEVNTNTSVEKGLVKIITQPGGEMGTEAFISNNENREADVYYRPNY